MGTPPTNQGTGRLAAIGWPALLVIVGVLAYANSLDGPFIYDDQRTIEEAPQIRDLWPPWRAAWSPAGTGTAGRPVVGLTVALNYAVGGLDVRGYHVVNIAVHVLCALALFGIVRRTLVGPRLTARFGAHADGLAGAAALLWMVHPLTSECVNYIGQRTESIMALFYLLTLYCAVRALRSDRARAWGAASVIACTLGMASKESMVTAPVMVVVYDRVFAGGSFRDLLRRRAGLYAGLAATWGVLAALMATGPTADSVGFTLGVSGYEYALNQSLVIARYLQLAVWPSPLIIDYGFPAPLTFGAVALPAALLAALVAATLVALARRPPVGYLGVWFFATLAPTSTVVPIVTEVGADKRMYLPLVALAVGAVIAAFELIRAAGVPGRLRIGLGAALLAVTAGVLGRITSLRNEDYDNPEILWRQVVAAVPANHRGHNNLGNALLEDGRLQEALTEYLEAVRLDPGYLPARENAARALLAAGRPQEAIGHYVIVLSARPEGDAALRHRLDLARAFMAVGALDGALEQYELVVQARPADADALHGLAIALGMAGRFDEAIARLNQVLELRPDDAEAEYHLGVAYRSTGRLDEAAASFIRTIELEPGNAAAHNSLGSLRHEQGRIDEAIGHYRRALEADPDLAAAHHNLGLALQSQGKDDEAAEHLRRAEELRR